jgi:surfactin synthase thioesterase subunit
MLVGDDDPHTTIAEAEAWADHTTARFDVRVFPGGHFYLDRHQAEIAALIAGAVKEIAG